MQVANSNTAGRPDPVRPQDSGRQPAYLPAAVVLLLFGALILGAASSAEGAVLLAEPVEIGPWPISETAVSEAAVRPADNGGETVRVPRLSGVTITSLGALGLLGAMLVRERRPRHGRADRRLP